MAPFSVLFSIEKAAISIEVRSTLSTWLIRSDGYETEIT